MIDLDLQPLILFRSNHASSAAVDLQLGGYVVFTADSDELALWLLRTTEPEAVVVELGLRETEAFAARLPQETPLLVISSMPRALQRRFPSAMFVTGKPPREELIATTDRLLIDRLTKPAAA